MLTPPQRRHALESRHPQWRSRTISQQLDASAEVFGDRAFVITDERIYTYRDIQRWSIEIAAGLVACGAQVGDHVAMVMANFPEYVAIKFAIARIGAVAVPINYLLRQRELSYVLGQSDSSVLIAMDALRDRNYLQDLDAIVPGWRANGGGELLPQLRHVFIHATSGSGDGARTLANLVGLATPAALAEVARREAAADPFSVSDVVYTSGTTGLSKGVMIAHDMVLRTAYASAYTRAFEDGRRILFALPMYHVFGYVECLLACMFVGGAIIPQVAFDAETMLATAERIKPVKWSVSR